MSEIKLGEIIKMELETRKMSAHELCKALHIPPSVMSGWINGVSPSAKNLPLIRKLADYFDLPINVLLFNQREGEENKASVLFASTFKDGKSRYRLVIEKLEEE